MSRDEYKKSLEGLPEDRINSLLAEFDSLTQNLTSIQDERKNLISDRDKAKSRVNTLLDKLGVDEDGNPKKPDQKIIELNQKLGEYEKSISDLNTQITQLKPFQDKATKMEKDRRDELIAQLPEDEKLKAIATKISSLEDLKEYVTITNEKLGKKPTDQSRGGKGTVTTDGKKWNDFTYAERDIIKKENPAFYEKIFKERYPKGEFVN